MNSFSSFRPMLLFQSTFPRGERPSLDDIPLQTQDFNPRSRVGNDRVIYSISSISRISIHVPAWGTTAIQGINYNMAQFQSTFPRGERLQISTNILCPFYATSTIFYFYYPFSLFLLCYSFYFSYFFSANSPIILCLLLVRTYIIKG